MAVENEGACKNETIANITEVTRGYQLSSSAAFIFLPAVKAVMGADLSGHLEEFQNLSLVGDENEAPTQYLVGTKLSKRLLTPLVSLCEPRRAPENSRSSW